MPDQSGTNTDAVDVDVKEAGVDAKDGSRRGFLMLGAAVVAGFVDACSANAPGTGNGTSGSTGSGGAVSSGGATSGGAPTFGGSTSGGATSGGAPSSGGTNALGGSTSQGGAVATGGAPAGGNVNGGGRAGGGGAPGGSGPGGGAPGGGAGGMVSAGGSGGGGPTGGMWVENRGASCMIGMVPTSSTAMANSKLPDLFKFINGMRLSRKEDWECLRAELSALAQACIYGPKMPPPDKLDATFSGGKLTINMTVGSKTGSFSVTISGGGSQSSPVPCLITCGGSSLPKMSGVAQIDMPNNTIAQESKTVNSGGLVTTLYGSMASKSGSLIGWAWGLSRIIDALEKCPEAGIDTKRIAVTGCSRNGKGALAMGAFDERVALTIPQEGGSGGPALWRVSTAEKKAGQNIQEATEIVGEANWQGSDFRSYANQVDKLPADQHTAIALCAPRAVLVIENDIDWLGPVATYGGGVAARLLFEGLGIKDRCGVSVASNHMHCQFPSAQQKYLDAFVTRFLKGGTADTNVDDFHVSSSTSKLQKFDKTQWIDWDIPTLSGNLSWDPFA